MLRLPNKDTMVQIQIQIQLQIQIQSHRYICVPLSRSVRPAVCLSAAHCAVNLFMRSMRQYNLTFTYFYATHCSAPFPFPPSPAQSNGVGVLAAKDGANVLYTTQRKVVNLPAHYAIDWANIYKSNSYNSKFRCGVSMLLNISARYTFEMLKVLAN